MIICTTESSHLEAVPDIGVGVCQGNNACRSHLGRSGAQKNQCEEGSEQETRAQRRWGGSHVLPLCRKGLILGFMMADSLHVVLSCAIYIKAATIAG